MVNLMQMFDGADVSLSGASYRVEMLDVDSSTGAFAFGMLRRKDSQRGRIAAGSNGIRMTPSAMLSTVL